MIYLDHNACSPPTAEHLQKLFEILSHQRPTNPSSPHALGRSASVLLSQARKNLARALNVDAGEIIFTSGGTEANNMGTRAVVEKHLRLYSSVSIITTALEHPCVLKPLEQLREAFKDLIELIIIKPNANGYILASDVISNIKPNTILISIIAAHNEIGTVQPVKQIGDFLNAKRWFAGDGHDDEHNLSSFLNPDISVKNLQDLHFHVDAVQIFGKIRHQEWMSQGYDSIALSGHKLGALQGVGALMLRRGRTFLPLNIGGAQEKNRRAGTENIPGIISFGMICENILSVEYWNKVDKMRKLTHLIFDELSKNKKIVLNSHEQQSCNFISGGYNTLPNTVHFSLLEYTHQAEDLILNLDMQNIYVSSGSACSSAVNLESAAVLALGRSKQLAANSVRISLGIETTKADVQIFLDTIASCIMS